MATERLRSESPQFEAVDTKPSKKRKRTDGDDSQKTKSQSMKPRDIDDGLIDSEQNLNHAIAHMDSSLMADHIAQRTKRFRPDLSIVEADDVHIPASAIRDTTSFATERTTEHLPDFIEEYGGGHGKKNIKKLSSAPTEPGSPHTLIIAAAGLRAADLTRAVRRFQTKDSMVAKLFAKHIKLKEATEMVAKTPMGIGVGTPQRIGDLIDNGSLKINQLQRIIIDASHIDQKKRGILDIKEVQVPLVDLLTRKDLRERYEDNSLQLLFF